MVPKGISPIASYSYNIFLVLLGPFYPLKRWKWWFVNDFLKFNYSQLLTSFLEESTQRFREKNSQSVPESIFTADCKEYVVNKSLLFEAMDKSSQIECLKYKVNFIFRIY